MKNSLALVLLTLLAIFIWQSMDYDKRVDDLAEVLGFIKKSGDDRERLRLATAEVDVEIDQLTRQGLKLAEVEKIVGEQAIMIDCMNILIGDIEENGILGSRELIIGYEKQIRLFGAPGLIRALEKVVSLEAGEIDLNEDVEAEIEARCEPFNELVKMLEEHVAVWSSSALKD